MTACRPSRVAALALVVSVVACTSPSAHDDARAAERDRAYAAGHEVGFAAGYDAGYEAAYEAASRAARALVEADAATAHHATADDAHDAHDAHDATTPPAEPTVDADGRPLRWAQPLDVPGLPNLHRVDDGLYRSAQPDATGMRRARDLGVRTVVNLRSFHSDRDELGDTGLGYEHLYVKAWHPELKEVVRFLQVASDPARRPVLVHCQHGADRTGIMVAAYRVCVQGWTKAEAIAELTRGGYGFHSIWFNLVDFVDELDVTEVRRRAGIAPPTGG